MKEKKSNGFLPLFPICLDRRFVENIYALVLFIYAFSVDRGQNAVDQQNLPLLDHHQSKSPKKTTFHPLEHRKNESVYLKNPF